MAKRLIKHKNDLNFPVRKKRTRKSLEGKLWKLNLKTKMARIGDANILAVT
jgi:hypothetical protein